MRHYGSQDKIVAVFFNPKYDKYCDNVLVVYISSENGHYHTEHCKLDGTNGYGIKRFSEVRPKKTVAWGKDDFIKHRGCLFRKSSERGVIYSSVGLIADDHVQFHYSTLWFYENLPFEYSSDDGVTWLPCTKEVTE